MSFQLARSQWQFQAALVALGVESNLGRSMKLFNQRLKACPNRDGFFNLRGMVLVSGKNLEARSVRPKYRLIPLLRSGIKK